MIYRPLQELVVIELAIFVQVKLLDQLVHALAVMAVIVFVILQQLKHAVVSIAFFHFLDGDLAVFVSVQAYEKIL